MIQKIVLAVLWVIAALIVGQYDMLLTQIIAVGFMILAALTIVSSNKKKKIYYTNEMVIKASYTFLDVKSLTPFAVLETILRIPSQEVDSNPDRELYGDIIRNAGKDWLDNNVKRDYKVLAQKEHQDDNQ